MFKIDTGKTPQNYSEVTFRSNEMCKKQGKWCVTDKKNDTFFVRVEMSLDIRIHSWQCADKNLSTSGDCSGLNLYNVTHSYKEDNHLYSGILLKVKKTTKKTTESLMSVLWYEICCRETNGKSNEDAYPDGRGLYRVSQKNRKLLKSLIVKIECPTEKLNVMMPKILTRCMY